MKQYKSYSLLLFLFITGFIKAADNNNRKKETLILLTAQVSCLTLYTIGLGLQALEKKSGNNNFFLSQELINDSKNMFAWTLILDCAREWLDLVERLLPN